MTRTTAFAFFPLLCAAATAPAAERRFSVADFDKVQVEGAYQVAVVSGGPSGVRAIGAARDLEGLSIDVQGGQLRIRRGVSSWGGYPGEKAGPVRIEVSTRELHAASVLGAGSLTVDRLGGLRTGLSVSGSGRIDVRRVDSDNLMIGLIGAGRVGAVGSARQVKASLQGSGDLDAAGLMADDLVLNTETAGSVAIGARRTANVRAAGAGDVIVGGSPACTVTTLGAGQVRCGSRR